MSATNFRIHTKQQAKLQFYISWSLNFWIANWKTKGSAPSTWREHSLWNFKLRFNIIPLLTTGFVKRSASFSLSHPHYIQLSYLDSTYIVHVIVPSFIATFIFSEVQIPPPQPPPSLRLPIHPLHSIYKHITLHCLTVNLRPVYRNTTRSLTLEHQSIVTLQPNRFIWYSSQCRSEVVSSQIRETKR